MTGFETLFRYATEVLSFDFKAGGATPALPDPPHPKALERMVTRCRAAFERSGREHLVLLGLGSGALAGALAQSLPPGALYVCEQNLPLVRGLRAAGRLGWWTPDGSAGLATDASAFAVLLLLDRLGLGQGNTLVLPSPELRPEGKAALRRLELLLTRSRPVELPLAVFPRLSVAAILSPQEPDLPEFFAQFPDWVQELVLVWDAEVLPNILMPTRFPVWQTARCLERDFSAQRNLMLSACAGDWVLYLDADERLSPQAWAAIPSLCGTQGVGGWHLPRLTPYPTPDRALIGFGLWPDVQLRLFRNTPGLTFVNPVHERLTGISGAQALALDLEIEHVSRLRKDTEALRSKLSGFDAAGAVRHVLSGEYPSLPRELLAAPARQGLPRGLILPPGQD